QLAFALGALCLAFGIAGCGTSSNNSAGSTSGLTPLGKELKPESNRGTAKEQIPINIEVNVGKTGRVVSPLLFGTNLEHTRNAIWRGLGAQVIANCKFAGPAHSDGLVAGWSPVGAPAAHFQIDREKPFAGEQSQRISLAAEVVVAGIAQDHVPLLKNCAYQGRLALRSEKALKVSVRVCDQQGENCYKVQTLSVKPGEWRELEFSFTPSRTDRE